jgi:predicted ArsR family transcriptional regulator
LTENEQKILNILKSKGPRTTKQLVTATKLSDQGVRKIMGQLKDRGQTKSDESVRPKNGTGRSMMVHRLRAE